MLRFTQILFLMMMICWQMTIIIIIIVVQFEGAGVSFDWTLKFPGDNVLVMIRNVSNHSKTCCVELSCLILELAKSLPYLYRQINTRKLCYCRSIELMDKQNGTEFRRWWWWKCIGLAERHRRNREEWDDKKRYKNKLYMRNCIFFAFLESSKAKMSYGHMLLDQINEFLQCHPFSY